MAQPVSSAAGWAALTGPDSDDDEMLEPVIPMGKVAIPNVTEVEHHIEQMSADTTLMKLNNVTAGLNAILVNSSTHASLAHCALLYDKILSKLAAHGKRDLLEHELDVQQWHTFASEELISTDEHNPKTLESHTAEANRLGIDRKALGRRSALASISAIVLQHECANAFLDGFCNKTESNGGTCEVYYEKHRGDETPYSKCKASDPL